MTPPTGQFRIGPPSSRLFVKTSRTGLGARAGHDLTIEVTRWSGEVSVPSADPTDATLRIEVDADSFAVREGAGGVLPLSNADRAEIERTISEKILFPDRYPVITFESTSVSATGDDLEIDGELTIMSLTRPLTARATVHDDGGVHGRAAVTQSDWGIKPYSAFFGALRLADEVAVEVDSTLGD